MPVIFEVPGQPRGYVSHGKTPNWRRMNQYHEWMKEIAAAATAAGLSLPLRPTSVEPIRVDIQPLYQDRRHSDPENTRKGVVDALCWAPKGQKQGDDRWVCGWVPLPSYDRENPRVIVRVYLDDFSRDPE